MKRRNYKGRELLPLAGERRGPHRRCRCCGTGLAVLRGLHKQALHPDGLRRKRLSPYLPGRVHEKPSGKQTHPRHSRRELITGPDWGEQLTFSLFLPPVGLVLRFGKGKCICRKSNLIKRPMKLNFHRPL